MANYSAVIDLRVTGQGGLDAVKNRLDAINNLIKNVKPVPSLFDRRANAEILRAKDLLAEVVKKYAEGGQASARFATSIAGINQQLQAFKTVANNAKVGTDEFKDALTAAALGSNRLLRAELERADELQNVYTKTSFATKKPNSIVADLLALKSAVPNSIAALERYQLELKDVQRSVSMTSTEFEDLGTAINQVDVALGRVQFGPVKPPTTPTGKKTTTTATTTGPAKGSLAFNPNPTQENLALGAGFPLLFGGGVGQVGGGLIGSLFGGGFGGQILGAAIGQQLTDAFVRITDIGKALNTLNMDKLRDSVITVNSALDYQVSLLIRAGKAEEARALAARAVFEQTGLTAGAVERATNTSNQLKNAWDGVVGALSGTISILVNVMAPTFIGVLRTIEALFKGINAIVTVIGDAGAAAGKWALELVFGKDVAEQIYNFFKGTNEEEEKLTAELGRSVDEQKRGLALSEKLLAIDKTRTSDTSTRGKLINIEADQQEKLARILFDFDEKRKVIQEKYGALKTAEGKKLLADSLALNEAEKNIAIESAKLTTERQKQQLLTKQIAEEDRSTVVALQAQQQAIAAQAESWNAVGSIVTARIGAEQQLNALQKVRLERDYENAKTAQKRYEISLALFRNEVVSAQLEYQNTLASIALETEKLKLQQSMAVLKGYEILAEGKLQILKADSVEEESKKRQQVEEAVAAQNQVIQGLGTQITAQQVIGKYQAEGAEAAYKTKIETAGMALQQKLASDAIGLSADKAKNIATNMVTAYTNTDTMKGITQNLTVKMNDAAVAATRGAKGVTQLSTASLGAAKSTDVWRQAILDKEAATNKAFQEEYVAIQENLKQKQAAYDAAVAAATKGDKEIVDSSNNTRKVVQSGWTVLVGNVQRLFRALVSGLVNNLNKAIQFINKVIDKNNALPTPPFPNFPRLKELPVPAFAEGGAVTGPTLAMVGEGGEPEYIIPESKMAGALANYSKGLRGSSVIPAFANGGYVGSLTNIDDPKRNLANLAFNKKLQAYQQRGYLKDVPMRPVKELQETIQPFAEATEYLAQSAEYLQKTAETTLDTTQAPVINISTGPILEFNGERYVTVKDFNAGLQQLGDNIYKGLRKPSTRTALGLA